MIGTVASQQGSILGPVEFTLLQLHHYIYFIAHSKNVHKRLIENCELLWSVGGCWRLVQDGTLRYPAIPMTLRAGLAVIENVMSGNNFALFCKFPFKRAVKYSDSD